MVHRPIGSQGLRQRPYTLTLTRDKYLQGRRDVVYIQERIKDTVDVSEIMKFIGSDSDKSKLSSQSGEKFDYIPTKYIRVPVDSATVVGNGTVAPENAHQLRGDIIISLNRRHLTKSDVMVLDLLAANNWERPVYFVSLGHSGTLGLEPYMQLEGLAYRLVPIKGGGSNYLTYGRIDTKIFYDNLMNKFLWRGINDPEVHLDHFHERTLSVIRFRHNYVRLAEALMAENKKDSAIAVLDRCVQLAPHSRLPYGYFVPGIVETYAKLGEKDKALAIINDHVATLSDELTYYTGLDRKYANYVDQESRLNLQLMQNYMQVLEQLNEAEKLEEMRNAFNGFYMSYNSKMQGQ
ncbi:MAG: hypothetical protein HC896_15265 [Bacteroidales bacterium]|nr:hypothetical protein [Bacteroidales bacterium]